MSDTEIMAAGKWLGMETNSPVIVVVVICTLVLIWAMPSERKCKCKGECTK